MASIPDFGSLFDGSTSFDPTSLGINTILPSYGWGQLTSDFTQSVGADNPPDFSAAAGATPTDQFSTGVGDGMGTAQMDAATGGVETTFDATQTGAPDITGSPSAPDFNQPGGASVTQPTDINQTPAAQPSAWDQALSWYKNLPTTAQDILLRGTVGVATAGMTAYAASQQRKILQEQADTARKSMENQQAQYEQNRQDVARQHEVPALGGASYQQKGRTGILNSALGGPGYSTPNVPPPPPQPPPII